MRQDESIFEVWEERKVNEKPMSLMVAQFYYWPDTIDYFNRLLNTPRGPKKLTIRTRNQYDYFVQHREKLEVL